MFKKAFTLIELVIFIVILGIIGVGILMALNTALEKAPNMEYMSRAAELAQQRMDLILGQKQIYGFDLMVDPCSASPSLAVCLPPTGYTVSSAIANNWGGDTNYKVITVTVSGLGSATLTGMVANYED